MDRVAKVEAVARAFMADNPEEYKGETVEQVVAEITQCSDEFIEKAYSIFCVDT